jgi:hypothetical protein
MQVLNNLFQEHNTYVINIKDKIKQTTEIYFYIIYCRKIDVLHLLQPVDI